MTEEKFLALKTKQNQQQVIVPYVVGFLFNEYMDEVILLEKTHSKWQWGKLNGVGGVIEPDETPEEAMQREAKEEIGVDINYWSRFASVRGINDRDEIFELHFFFACNNDEFLKAEQKTDEKMLRVKAKQLEEHEIVPDIYWLIPMAMTMENGRAAEYIITEVPQSTQVLEDLKKLQTPIDMLLYCPRCGAQHIDQPQPEKNWNNPAHKSHECQNCFYVWRPSDVFTNGVAAINSKGKNDQNPKPYARGE